MPDILIRLLGICGLILCAISFQFKKHKKIVLCKMTSEFLFSAQYFLMGAYTGAVLDLISGLRNFLFYKFVEKKRSTTPIIVAFGLLVLVLGILSCDGWMSLLPIGAKLLTTISYGMKKERLLRFITLPSCLLWLSYNALVGAWEAMIGDSLALISILVAIYKFDILQKAQEEHT